MTLDLPTPPLPEPMQITLLDLGQRTLGQAAAAELAAQRRLLVAGEHVEADVDAGDAVELAHGLRDAGLEVAADRAAWGGQGHHHVHHAVGVDVDRPHHLQLDDVAPQLGVDDRAEGLGDLFGGRHAIHSSRRSRSRPARRLAAGAPRPSGDRGRQAADEREHVEVVVEQVLAHDAAHAGVAQRGQLLGRRARAVPTIQACGGSLSRARRWSRSARPGACARSRSSASSAPTTNPVMTLNGSGSPAGRLARARTASRRVRTSSTRRERGVVLVGVAGRQRDAARAGRAAHDQRRVRAAAPAWAGRRGRFSV